MSSRAETCSIGSNSSRRLGAKRYHVQLCGAPIGENIMAMKPRFLVPALAALFTVSACNEKDKKQGSEGSSVAIVGETGKLVAPDTSANGAEVHDVENTNELWAMAPHNTIVGVVAAPGAVSKLYGMMMNIIVTAEAQPLGAMLLAEIREKSKDEVIDVLAPASIKDAGIDINGAAAIFFVSKNQGFLILPVVDREAFREITKGTLKTIDGMEVDQIEEELVCTAKSNRYLCANTVALLKEFGDNVNSRLASRIAELPSEYRGHVEYVMDFPGIKKVNDAFVDNLAGQVADPQLGISSIRLGNGSITMRGWFQMKPLDIAAAAASVSNTLTAALGASKPSSLFSLRVPMDGIIAEIPNKDEKIAGLDLKKDVMSSFTGEIVGYTPPGAGLWGRVAVGIKDPAPFKALLNMGCGLVPAMGIPGVEVTPGDGKCSAMIDVARLPLPDKAIGQMFEKPVSITAEVKADRVEVTLGKEEPATHKPLGSAHKPLSTMGSELMSKPWNFSMWTEGMSIANSVELPWNQVSAAVPADIADEIKMAVWMLAHVYEVGMTVGIRDDGLHSVMHVATYAGDAPEALKAYQATVAKTLSSGSASAEFAAIREKWPNSMAARGGTGAGSLMVTGLAGVLASVALPAFTKYQEKSEEAAEMFKQQAAEMQQAPL